jgi:hypothetical protein
MKYMNNTKLLLPLGHISLGGCGWPTGCAHSKRGALVMPRCITPTVGRKISRATMLLPYQGKLVASLFGGIIHAAPLPKKWHVNTHLINFYYLHPMAYIKP